MLYMLYMLYKYMIACLKIIVALCVQKNGCLHIAILNYTKFLTRSIVL